MSEMSERVQALYEIALEAIGSDRVNTSQGSATDRALTFAARADDPDEEMRLMLGALGHFVANVVTASIGEEQARTRLRAALTLNAVDGIFDDAALDFDDPRGDA
jgi:hypothetical protein